MPQTLDDLIKPLGPRIEAVRAYNVSSQPNVSHESGGGFFRQHGLVMLASCLSVAVAVMWSIQSGYLTLAQQPPMLQIALPAMHPFTLPHPAPTITPTITPKITPTIVPTTVSNPATDVAPGSCTDSPCGELPNRITIPLQTEENKLPEIRSGLPPQMSKPEIITLPPDLSSVSAMPVQRPQTPPAQATKPATKNKPVRKELRT